MDVAAKFESEISRCMPLLGEDEWVFANARDNIVSGLKPSEAFASVVSVLYLGSRQFDEYAFSNCCWLASQLAKISDTTECPEGLVDALRKLYAQALSFGQNATKEVKVIAKWYRAENAL